MVVTRRIGMIFIVLIVERHFRGNVTELGLCLAWESL
jgi:hypothetical protein